MHSENNTTLNNVECPVHHFNHSDQQFIKKSGRYNEWAVMLGRNTQISYQIYQVIIIGMDIK